MATLADRVLAALPQTQCTRCGYPDCAAYATAIADDSAAINQCPPGGAQGIARLARITGQPVLPLNPANGSESARSVAFVDEDWCIGCTLCIKACPTDAIVGSNKLMHFVMERYCTGCALCLPVCPVDCIVLENASGNATGWNAWSDDLAALARDRYAQALARREPELPSVTPMRDQDEGASATARETTDPATASGVMPDRKREIVAAAQARARALRQR